MSFSLLSILTEQNQQWNDSKVQAHKIKYRAHVNELCVLMFKTFV